MANLHYQLSYDFIGCWKGEFFLIIISTVATLVVIISYILLTLLFDLGVMLKGEIKCQSLKVDLWWILSFLPLHCADTHQLLYSLETWLLMVQPTKINNMIHVDRCLSSGF